MLFTASGQIVITGNNQAMLTWFLGIVWSSAQSWWQYVWILIHTGCTQTKSNVWEFRIDIFQTHALWVSAFKVCWHHFWCWAHQKKHAAAGKGIASVSVRGLKHWSSTPLNSWDWVILHHHARCMALDIFPLKIQHAPIFLRDTWFTVRNLNRSKLAWFGQIVWLEDCCPLISPVSAGAGNGWLAGQQPATSLTPTGRHNHRWCKSSFSQHPGGGGFWSFCQQNIDLRSYHLHAMDLTTLPLKVSDHPILTCWVSFSKTSSDVYACLHQASAHIKSVRGEFWVITGIGLWQGAWP